LNFPDIFLISNLPSLLIHVCVCCRPGPALSLVFFAFTGCFRCVRFTAPADANAVLVIQPVVASAAVAVHTVSHLIVSGFIAWIVYDFIGLVVLRRSWINLDLIWCFTLLGAAVLLFFAPFA
jgi:hypothetical protein